MTRARLLGCLRRLVQLRVLCELKPAGRATQQARRHYECAVRMLEFQTGLTAKRLTPIAERFWVSWLREGRTPTIRRAKSKASDRVSNEALRALREAGRDTACIR